MRGLVSRSEQGVVACSVLREGERVTIVVQPAWYRFDVQQRALVVASSLLVIVALLAVSPRLCDLLASAIIAILWAASGLPSSRSLRFVIERGTLRAKTVRWWSAEHVLDARSIVEISAVQLHRASPTIAAKTFETALCFRARDGRTWAFPIAQLSAAEGTAVVAVLRHELALS